MQDSVLVRSFSSMEPELILEKKNTRPGGPQSSARMAGNSTGPRQGSSGRTAREGPVVSPPHPAPVLARSVEFSTPHPDGRSRHRIPTQPTPADIPTRRSQYGGCRRVWQLPLEVQTGDHLVDEVGGPVRNPPPVSSEDTGHSRCQGIRWYPRLACPQGGEHIGGAGGQMDSVVRLRSVSAMRHYLMFAFSSNCSTFYSFLFISCCLSLLVIYFFASLTCGNPGSRMVFGIG
jgi:hypothetical protein